MNFLEIRTSIVLLFLLLLLACVTGEEFDALTDCDRTMPEFISVSDLLERLDSGVGVISEELALRLYVTSSDRYGNIYGSIYMQDHPSDPTVGLELKTELRDAYLNYPRGAEVFLNLKGLCVRVDNGSVQVGSKLETFGNLTLGRIPSIVMKEHLITSCGPLETIVPKEISLGAIKPQYQYTYVSINDLQVSFEDLCKSFAEPKETSVRRLYGCDQNSLELLNSGYSDFYPEALPSGNGTAAGILNLKGNKPQLILNSRQDLAFENKRCGGIGYSCVPPEPNSTIREVKAIYSGNPVMIGDRVVEAVIIANDRTDVFGKELYIKDTTGAIRITIDRDDLYKDGFELGRTVRISFNGLVVDSDHGELVVGYPDELSWKPIPGNELYRFAYRLEKPLEVTEPVSLTPEEVQPDLAGEYVEISGVQFMGSISSAGKGYTAVVTGCSGNSLLVDFPDAVAGLGLITGQGSIRGILTNRGQLQLKVMDTDHLASMDGERCSLLPGATSLSYVELLDLISPDPETITGNYIIEGVVVSDSGSGNFPGDQVMLQTEAGSLLVSFSRDHEIQRGSRIEVSLMGGRLMKANELPEVEGLLDDQVRVVNSGELPLPETVTINQLINRGSNGEWVRLYPVQLENINSVLSHGVLLQDCLGSVRLQINNDAKLNGVFPGSGSGGVFGFYYKDHFYPGNPGDLVFDEVRMECSEDTISEAVFISELADPVNTDSSLNARFLELFNASDAARDLTGWEIRRYTNGNTDYTPGTVIDLTGMIIPAKGTLVIAASADQFEAVYGFSPDMAGGISSGADSNGDDNIVLIDSSGTIADIFGIPGEDGSGTAHDFKDGRAVRVLSVTNGSPVFYPEQWEVYNDHGGAGTLLKIHYAPLDFDPGVHQ